jgi:imidazolonepropionase-like amidohydrolase
MSRSLALAIAVGALVAGSIAAAEPPGSDCLVISGGIVHLPQGPVPGATVVIRGGRIAEAGPRIPAPSGCRVLDASDKVVTPGLVDAYTRLGLVEIGMEAHTVDSRPDKADPAGPAVRPSFQVADGYNPRSTLVPIARAAGVTSALVVPDGGLVAGQSAWVDLRGATQAEAVRRAAVAMHVYLGGGEGSRIDSLHRLRGLLAEARAFLARQADWERNQARPFSLAPDELRAMGEVLSGKMPLVVASDRAAEIEAVLRFADAERVRVVLLGGAEAWMLAPELARRGVAVIVDPLLNAPESFDRIHARADNAALLHAAGVPVILSAFDTHRVGTLPQAAGNAVRAGLDHAVAVQAITKIPAEVFGLPDAGVLAQGAVANVVVWSGDPLELSSVPQHVILSGQEVPRSSRQSLLRDRYRTLPGTPQAPLSLP